MLKYVTALSLLWVSAALAQTTVQEPLPYGECLQRLQTPMTGAVGDPIVLVDTEQTKTVQYLLPDGLVTITCTAVDQQVTIRHSGG